MLWYASSVRAQGLLSFNTAIVVSKELNCKELEFSLEIHVDIFHYCSKTCGHVDCLLFIVALATAC